MNRLGTRAVVRACEAGVMTDCAGGCGQAVKFVAIKKVRKVICNVYESGKWDRVEIWHPECYESAGMPHGDPGEYEQKRHKAGDPSD